MLIVIECEAVNFLVGSKATKGQARNLSSN